ncbi:lasso peptide biosynthesis PqqD family chaperone [Streptomyces sp. IBSNAI002]|uniref:lasso peptide biosynthesis PqqD family chaperone n=1 Tax=Streptomyces sp. IBSNAI002 TaxID=3457500 RepID=UPI003FD3E714
MTVRLCPGTTTAETDDGTVLLNERTGDHWQLNATGSIALERLLAGHGIGALAADVAAVYGISAVRAREDLTALLSHLRAAGLIEAG